MGERKRQNKFATTTHQYAKSLGSSDLTKIKIFMCPTTPNHRRYHTGYKAVGLVLAHLLSKVLSKSNRRSGGQRRRFARLHPMNFFDQNVLEEYGRFISE